MPSQDLLKGVDQLRLTCQLEPVDRYAGVVRCLKCEKDFRSQDRRSIRVCSECKKSADWVGSRESDCDFPAVPTNVAQEMIPRIRNRKSFGGELPKSTKRKKRKLVKFGGIR
jgi:hypothetical protein